MIKTLLLLILSCFRISFYILRIAIIKALLPRMPPSNWGKERKENHAISVGQVDEVPVIEENSRIIKLWKRGKYCYSFVFRNGLEQLNVTCPSSFPPPSFSSIDQWSWSWLCKRRRRNRSLWVSTGKPFHCFGWQDQPHTDQTFNRRIWVLSLL